LGIQSQEISLLGPVSLDFFIGPIRSALHLVNPREAASAAGFGTWKRFADNGMKRSQITACGCQVLLISRNFNQLTLRGLAEQLHMVS
jgi:hypothetical protein